MATAQIAREQFLRLSYVPWSTYLNYSDDLGPRHIRVTFDQGEMEVMTLSPRHENWKKRLARLVETMTEELGIDVASFGSMTCRREDLSRALEADECYWIQNEAAVRGRDDIDLEVDPPPDLVLEIEVCRSTLDRLSIYAALGVREVWRWDGENFRVCVLAVNGGYRVTKRSRAFPFLPLPDFAKFLAKTDSSETQLLQTFRKWVRTQKAAGWKTSRNRPSK